jgi:flagellar hook assembly protein FlgD
LLRWSLPGAGTTRLAIYDVTGQVVREFLAIGNGVHEFFWDGTAESGEVLPGGIYFAALEQNREQKAVQKVMILR